MAARPGRVEFAGCYPGDYSRVTWWACRYSITCAAARGAQAIAADISRRLLPDYHAELDKVLRAIADHLTALDEQAATAAAVAAAIPGARSRLFGSDPPGPHLLRAGRQGLRGLPDH
ncbi:hypothetical protein [Nonomuraea gerenzanensis]|uniref:hypothetical protein n=1 Tax=Nonomuraea gerenzanensis TaxID=93944 RepID=UPI001CD9F14A|nr:hypothetical protein [Nonomuraea gerenzanensis]UBU10373.1 hypothetical protein LCN96_39425 [Nonomuraea gerenzanensis]